MSGPVPIEKLTTIDEVRAVLKEEVHHYHDNQIHSTTGNSPSIHFEKARKEENNLFSSFCRAKKPYTFAKDVFCLGER